MPPFAFALCTIFACNPSPPPVETQSSNGLAQLRRTAARSSLGKRSMTGRGNAVRVKLHVSPHQASGGLRAPCDIQEQTLMQSDGLLKQRTCSFSLSSASWLCVTSRETRPSALSRSLTSLTIGSGLLRSRGRGRKLVRVAINGARGNSQALQAPRCLFSGTPSSVARVRAEDPPA